MKLKKIQLKNFRNYETLELEFSKNIICFTGLNGQGKTNIAEAVSVLGLLSSFRTV
ncbi:MAG: AAA family ATPase, partial [Candidatus Delongbacteria bacterium]|nr:AAA family ATPase [Candidatus Delongbacteria bacterium]